MKGRRCMEYVIGIDGGGTKSAISIADLRGNIILTEYGGPTNIRAQEESQVYDALKSLIESAIKRAALKMEDCKAICIGTAGAGRKEEQEIIKEYVRSVGLKGNIVITNDAEIVIAEMTGGREGIAVIAGTGSIAYGIGKNGERVRVGGWGHIVGDEGSAYYIGLEAIKAALRCYDGREPYTHLLPMLMEEIGITAPEEFVRFVYRRDIKKSEIAALARVVDRAHKKGDNKAKEILIDAAEQLFLLAKAAIRGINAEQDAIMVVVSGSVLINNLLVYEQFVKLLAREYPNVTVEKAKADASRGAVIVALKSIKLI
ncbi:MAG: hypothetical protein PWR01_564 [Clostridiales bacterium]|nr:hypothetical protein [Clostridiales bacterium]